MTDKPRGTEQLRTEPFPELPQGHPKQGGGKAKHSHLHSSEQLLVCTTTKQLPWAAVLLEGGKSSVVNTEPREILLLLISVEKTSP